MLPIYAVVAAGTFVALVSLGIEFLQNRNRPKKLPETKTAAPAAPKKPSEPEIIRTL